MEASYTIQISSNLVNKLARESMQPPKKPKKTKPRKPAQPPKQKAQPKPVSTRPWPVQQPIFTPQPPSAPPSAELEAIKSMLQESESVMKKLEQKEANMTAELNQRARELRDREFRLPHQNSVACGDEGEACRDCYRENPTRPWRCEEAVKRYEGCALKAWKLHQQINSKA